MPYYIRDPKRDPNFDNHPNVFAGILAAYVDGWKWQSVCLSYRYLVFLSHVRSAFLFGFNVREFWALFRLGLVRARL